MIRANALMHWRTVEGYKSMQLFMVVLTLYGILEEHIHTLVHVHPLCAMDVGPDWEQQAVRLHVQLAALLLEEVHVEHGLVPLYIPVRVRHLEREQKIRVQEHKVFVDIDQLLRSVMPLRVHYTDL